MQEDHEIDGKPLGLADVAARLSEVSDGGGDEVSVGEMIAGIGQRAFGPLLLVFALIALSPIGSIPGASVLFGTLIILVAGQMLIGRRSPWFPKRLTRISVGRNKMRASMARIGPYLGKIDKVLKPRWRAILRPPSPRIVAALCIVLAALMYPLALVPWGVVAPALAIVVLSLGLTSHDGVLLAAGFVLSAAALGLSGYFLL